MGTRGITVPLHGEWGRAFQTVWQCVGSRCTGGGGIAIREGPVQLRKIAGKNCGKLRCRNQTPRSLKEQHFCTGGSECFCVSKQKIAGKMRKIAKTSEKIRKIAKMRKIAKNCEPQSPPPPSWCPCTHGLWRIVWGTASRAASCQDQGKQPVQGLHEKAGHAVLLAC